VLPSATACTSASASPGGARRARASCGPWSWSPCRITSQRRGRVAPSPVGLRRLCGGRWARWGLRQRRVRAGRCAARACPARVQIARRTAGPYAAVRPCMHGTAGAGGGFRDGGHRGRFGRPARARAAGCCARGLRIEGRQPRRRRRTCASCRPFRQFSSCAQPRGAAAPSATRKGRHTAEARRASAGHAGHGLSDRRRSRDPSADGPRARPRPAAALRRRARAWPRGRGRRALGIPDREQLRPHHAALQGVPLRRRDGPAARGGRQRGLRGVPARRRDGRELPRARAGSVPRRRLPHRAQCVPGLRAARAAPPAPQRRQHRRRLRTRQ
jgi:hypothetical protein